MEPKSTPKRSPVRPGNHREPQGHSRAPKSALRTAQSDARRGPEGAFGPHRSAQGGPKSAQGASKSLRKGVWEAQNRDRGARESKKHQFRQKCSATRPCRCTRHFGPPPNRPRIGPKSIQVGPSKPSSGLRGRFRSLEGASGGHSEQLGATRAASGAPRVAQGRLKASSHMRFFRSSP